MGKSTPTPPPAPDYAAAAREQGVANQTAAQKTAVLSNPNMVTPYGNQTVTYAANKTIDQAGYDKAMADYNANPGGMVMDDDGHLVSSGSGSRPDIAQFTTTGDLQPTVTQTLTPEAQKTLEAQQKVQYGAANLGLLGLKTAENVMGTPFQYGGPNVQTGLDMTGAAKAPVNAGMTGQNAIMARLQPQIEQQTKATAQNLANQGITPGSEAYNNAMREQQQGQNDLYSQAALQGIGLDTAAQQTAYNQALQSGQFGNTAANQYLSQQLGLYNQPLNQINALMSSSQIQTPQFAGYTGANIAPAPVFQGVQQQGQAAMDLYGQQMAAANAQTAGMYGLAGSIVGAGAKMYASDRRLKSNIVRVGTHPLGIGIYEYDIFDRRERGVMAQEVEKVRPEAVGEHPDGYKMVNYAALA
jgi:hypothetical protein